MKKNLNLNVTVNQVPANPVELMMGWCDLMGVLFIMTVATGVVVMRHRGEGVLAATFIVAFGLALVWLPGMLLASLAHEIKDYIGKTSSTYASAKSVFASGIKTAYLRCFRLPVGAGGIGLYLTLFLGTAILVGDVGTLFNEDVLVLSVVAGTLLSLGGGLRISARLLRDLLRERRLARQLL